VGGDWALEFESFLGIEPIGEYHLGPKNSRKSTEQNQHQHLGL
jgi:hypothetical protein